MTRPLCRRSASMLTLMLAATMIQTPGAVAAKPPPERCDLAEIDHIRELHDALGRRAVEVVALASRPEWKDDTSLTTKVALFASFRIGAGDVAGKITTGVEGLHSLVETIHADSFRFDDWNGMNGPADACAFHIVSVEFIDTYNKTSSALDFEFVDGQVVRATGWMHGFKSGSFADVIGPH